MITSLGIRDFVLIERLDLNLAAGLTVLTGETGAGKSILIDSLALVLGERGDSQVVRAGAAQATIIAEFDCGPNHPVRDILTKNDIPIGDSLILRRIIASDGRSRAAVNDQAVTVAVLREVGATLTEILGQFDGQGLLNPASHRGLVDVFGGNRDRLLHCRLAYEQWQRLSKELSDKTAAAAAARQREESDRAALIELTTLAPQKGEEDELLLRRSRLMQHDKIAATLQQVSGEISGDKGAEGQINRAIRALSKFAPSAESPFVALSDSLERAAQELNESLAQLERLATDIDPTDGGLELVEDRLHSLRSMARKHDRAVVELPDYWQELQARIDGLEGGGENLKKLETAVTAAGEEFHRAVQNLRQARKAAALKLDEAINRELKPLKLERAIFATRIDALPPSDWNGGGGDAVQFEVATNVGMPAGPLHKVASGGELSRMMLALSLVLTDSKPVDSLVFDEVDSGVGGATADAIGERLARLASQRQVLSVTHSPQVAARGQHHWRVEKTEDQGRTVTNITHLSNPERIEEIARMLSGAQITAEARAAATKLLGL
ncbi:MAG: DNA repair protein RecN [Candidatus Pacebacteria bacterium]|nr:DNA repair protein RecN [Candidatus Paceibacterota bacterium]